MFSLGGRTVLLIGKAHTCGDVIDPCVFPIILSGVNKNCHTSALHINNTKWIELQAHR